MVSKIAYLRLCNAMLRQQFTGVIAFTSKDIANSGERKCLKKKHR